ncbi:VOC family protein [Noviherbaspirillum sp. CPCC 100848]|uniref:VOC family protein n=1 Tax=Noviherbaspirillum album TaxID=3080276 RepID=A0ABU6J1S0_9BURK|nr:VOC family protein [Noviherbaspirillum sp. CPCC 100848]MEC4717579.1 VOC family protein [Noviherbaspirillum sp. CPCC 100848]
MLVQPYLFLDGRCEEAIEFYRSALGAQVDMLMRFKDNPDLKEHQDTQDPSACMSPPGADDKIMHASFRIGDSTIMASDGRCTGNPDFRGFSLSVSVPLSSDAEKLFSILAQDGKVEMPLAETFFSQRFGMVTDRFGVSWMVVVAA